MYLRDRMNALRRNALMHALMALLLLGVACLPVVSRLTCLKAGTSMLVLGDPSEHCPEPESPSGEAVRATCCVATTVGAAEQVYLPVNGQVDGEPALPLAVGAAPSRIPGAAPSQPGTGKAAPPFVLQRRLARLGVLRI